MVSTVTVSLYSTTSSLDAPTSVVSAWPDPDERRLITSTVGGEYTLPSEIEVDEKEARAWAQVARRSRARWRKENLF